METQRLSRQIQHSRCSTTWLCRRFRRRQKRTETGKARFSRVSIFRDSTLLKWSCSASDTRAALESTWGRWPRPQPLPTGPTFGPYPRVRASVICFFNVLFVRVVLGNIQRQVSVPLSVLVILMRKTRKEILRCMFWRAAFIMVGTLHCRMRGRRSWTGQVARGRRCSMVGKGLGEIFQDRAGQIAVVQLELLPWCPAKSARGSHGSRAGRL